MNALVKHVCIPLLSEDRKDILIKDGVLREYHSGESYDAEISGENLHLVPSFTDIGTFNGEPGYEERETIESLTKAAAHGGYGELLLLPLTHPVADSGSHLRNIKIYSGLNGVKLSPLGSISCNAEGKEISEILDMTAEGAVGFTDGYRSIQSSGLMIRALDYVKRFQRVIMNHPYDESVAPEGIINEGDVSMSMGLPGIPKVAEILMVQRDIDLLEYTQSRLHVWNISAAESVEIIKQAKERGLDISCSVSYLHLLKNENALKGYDVIYKIMPPLRTEEDRKALIQGVIDGTIDCINSLHCPWNEEKKDLEFVHAESGAAGLETVFPALWTYVEELRDWNLLDNCLNRRPREIFGLRSNTITFNDDFHGIIIDIGRKYTFDESHIKSNSQNYPYLGEELTGFIHQIEK